MLARASILQRVSWVSVNPDQCGTNGLVRRSSRLPPQAAPTCSWSILMLHRLGTRCSRSPSYPQTLRTISTVPKKLPEHFNAWDPSSRATVLKIQPTQGRNTRHKNVAKETVHRSVRKEMRDKCGIEIVGLRSSPWLIKRLNKSIALAASRLCDDALRRRIWRMYSLAKKRSPQLPSHIPNRCWDILWATLSPLTTMGNWHLREIYRDMQSTGKPTTVKQRVEYLEGLFLTGYEDTAIQEWEDDYHQQKKHLRHDFKAEHLELGARIYAMSGNPDRARCIMDELFELYPDWDSAIMMVVFRAYTQSTTEQHHEVAREFYTAMKNRLGKNATLHDYDGWFVGFLETRNLSYSTRVFKAMVTDGFIARDTTDGEIAGVLRRLHLLYRLGDGIGNMTSIALACITVLPESYRPHLFGDWLKSAVINNSPEATAQILEMMVRRGYEPQTFHFNLLLKSLFRSKELPNELKAENVAWKMIAAYQSSQEPRRSLSAIDAISKRERRKVTAGMPLDSDVAEKMPPANVTTFALLMRWHANRGQWEHVEYLARWLRDSKIIPNTALLNVTMENLCRQGKYNEVWDQYRSSANISTAPIEGLPVIFPDGATFRCLWRTLRLALSDDKTRENSSLPSPRELLRETLQWWELVRDRPDAPRFLMGLAAANHSALNTLMMHSFGYCNDLCGSLVALHLCWEKFGLRPSAKAPQILQYQIAWVDARSSATSQRDHQSGVFKRDVDKMAQIYEILKRERFERAGMTETKFEYLGDTEIADMNLNLISEFVRVVLKRKHPPEDVEAMIEDAKLDLGVPDMKIGDLDAYNVA